MMWFERVLVGFLAAICELFGVDSDRLAELQEKPEAPRSQGPTQTIHRIR